MTSLITITDIQAIRPIGQVNSTTNDRINMYIKEAQAFDVADSIGLALLADVIANPSTAPNMLLVTGGTYTVGTKVYECHGLKMAIAYYAYARIVKNNCVNVTAFGVTEKTTDNSEPASEAKVALVVREAIASGKAALQSCISLIKNVPTDYPLACTNSPRGGSFKIYGD